MKSPDTRFFLSPLLIGEQILSEEESKHATKVCRAQVGDILLVCDGKGKLAEAEILEANPKACKILIKSISILEKEPPRLQLAIACLKDDANEEVSFHVAQANVSKIILLRTEHSQEPKNSDLSRLVRRCHLKSRVSLKQSMKSWETEIEGPIELKDWLKTVEGTLVLCDINGQSQLENLDSNAPTTLLIGPEGGFSEKEIELIKNVPNAKTQLLKLGNTRLRARTAALLALGKLV